MKARHLVLTFFGLVWLTLIALGISALSAYASRPGEVGPRMSQWPENSGLVRSAKSNLVVFLHPECACSRATVAELNRILAQAPQDLLTQVVFVRPKTWTEEKLKGRLWQQAAAIPGVRLVVDSDSKEAELFGARTSGHTMLFDSKGAVLFTGGITGSRGHMGDNAGEASIVSLLQDRPSEVSSTGVFGCGLFSGAMVGVFSELVSLFGATGS